MTFPRLFSPGKVGNMELRNRIMLPPHVTRLAAKNGGATDALIAYYREKARAGAALVVIEGTYVVQHYPTRVYMGSDAFIPGYKQVSDAIHKYGAKAAVEINISRGSADEVEAVSPSGVPHPHTGVIGKPLSIDEIDYLVDTNAEGARRVRDAGFDAVMIHTSHGYLVSEFLSPVTNRRTDKYGGSLENRARFLLDLIHRTRAKTGPDFPILVRMLGHDRVGYFSFEDGAAVSKMCEDAGACFLDVTTGVAETYGWAVPPERVARACNIDASEVIKKAVSIPVCVTGRINDPYLAEQILEQGKADYVGMARALDADIDFIHKAQEGRPEEIRKCIACVRCNEFTLENAAPIRCSVNPFTGREAEIELKPAEHSKRILVVGAGPGGLEAARVAALRGHKVTVWEKSDRLGGQLNLACLPPDKAGLQPLIDFFAGQMQKLGVKVELGKEATAESVLALKPDVAIVAVGATSKLPDVPGGTSSNVVTATDVLSGKAKVGQRVVVLAVNSIGCEVAEYLADRYRDVTIVEPTDTVASDLVKGHPSPWLTSHPFLMHNLKRKMVRMLTNTRALSITEDGVNVVDAAGKERLLPADTVVAAVGFTPRKELFQVLEDKIRVYQIGDCAEPRRIMEATHDGAEVALQI